MITYCISIGDKTLKEFKDIQRRLLNLGFGNFIKNGSRGFCLLRSRGVEDDKWFDNTLLIGDRQIVCSVGPTRVISWSTNLYFCLSQCFRPVTIDQLEYILESFEDSVKSLPEKSLIPQL